MSDAQEARPPRLLDLFLTELHPKRQGLAPRWLGAKPAAGSPQKLYREPNLSWTLPESAPVALPSWEQVIELDVNGAFLAPLSSTYLGFHDLSPTGPLPFVGASAGYWKIGPYEWADWRIGSPLGKNASKAGGWYPTPLVELLVKLERLDKGPEVEILDSCLSVDPDGQLSHFKPTAWAERLGELRRPLVAALRAAETHGDQGDLRAALARYRDFKVSYSQAIQLLPGPKEGAKSKARVRRRDWYDTIRGAHKARTWFKAWSLAKAGMQPVAMDTTDTITIPLEYYLNLQSLQRADRTPKGCPKIDPTGLQLGAMKPADHVKEAEDGHAE